MMLKQRQLLYLVLFLIMRIPSADASTRFFNVTEYGARGDGQTLDTKAIQATIDTCAKEGGGTVVLSRGNFLSGMIFLKSNVMLHLDFGAILLGSTRLEDYPLTQCAFASYTDSYCGRALIWGEGLTNLGITGAGVIDGQGAAFRDNRPTAEVAAALANHWQEPTRHRPNGVYINRPYLIRLISCKSIRIKGVTLRNSAMWMQHYLNCESLRIHGISVYNHCAANNDMMDLDCCRDVIVSDCFGDSDDDALTFKSTAQYPTENVTVTNCILSSHCNAIKLGTESNGGFKNIAISNCTIRPSSDKEAMAGRNDGLAGIALEIVDGGIMDGISITNTTMTGQRTPLFIRLGNRARPFRKDMPNPPVGTLRNVIISNLVATGAGSTGCSITGIPGHVVENVTLDNLKIEFAGGGTQMSYQGVPEQVDKYPESEMFGRLPSYGLFCRHVNGLTLRDIDLRSMQRDPRPAVVCDDVRDLLVEHLTAGISTQATATVMLANASDVLLSGCCPKEGPPFLSLHGDCSGISVFGNDFRHLENPFGFEPISLRSVLFESANRP